MPASATGSCATKNLRRYATALLVAAFTLTGAGTAQATEDDWVKHCPTQPYSYAETAYPNGAVVRRHELRAGDQWDKDVLNWDDGRQRCEIDERHPYPMATHLWFAYSLKYTGSFEGVLSQFHQPAEAGESMSKPPPFALRAKNGGIQFLTRGDTRAITTGPILPETVRYTHTGMQAGQWYDIVVRARFDVTGAGGFTVWVDGVKVHQTSNIVLGYNDVNGPDFSHGVYRAASPNTTVVEFANVEVGTDTLLDRVTAPKPTP